MKTLGAAKLALYGIFLNYYCYYVIMGSFIPWGTVLFFGIACLGVGLDLIQRSSVTVGGEVKCWIAYAVLAFVTSIFGCSDFGFFGDILKYVQRLAIVMMVAYICERERSIRFGLRLMAVTAVACAISVLLVLDDFQLKLDISSGANLSDNDVGSIMAYGCFAILFCAGKRNRNSLWLSAAKAAAVICCIVVIFLSGSRKSIYAVLILAAMMLLLLLRDYRKQMKPYQLAMLLIVGAIACLFVVQNLLPYAEQTNLYRRLFGTAAERAVSSDEGRIELYIMALQDFAKHPFFGLGFNQFTEYHGNYTHSTYVEPLACSGMVGFLYLWPYVSIVKKQIRLIRAGKAGSSARLKQKEIFVYLCIFLFIGVGIPYMYKDVPCILLGTFLASQAISFDELKKDGQLSGAY